MGFVVLCPPIWSVLLSVSDGTVLVEREREGRERVSFFFFFTLPSPLSLLFKFWVASIGMSLLVWVFLGLGETIFLGAGVGVFCIACGSGDEGVFWITVESAGVILFLERVPWVPVNLVSDLSVCPRLFWDCRFFFSSESPESIRLPYLADFPPLRSLLWRRLLVV